MTRRKLLRLLAGGAACCLLPATARASAVLHAGLLGGRATIPLTESPTSLDAHVKEYLAKMERFDQTHLDDVVLDADGLRLLRGVSARLERLQRWVGHGNFALLGFDQGLALARNAPAVGAFSRAELDFLDQLFHADAARYGFLGAKPLSGLTHRVPEKDVHKVEGSGNWLFRGEPAARYERIRRQIGPEAVLTSGVRGIMKQFLLFLAKARACDGNLSRASRSLAPPGYSFHGVGDFDMGQAGFGIHNFSDRFTTTPVFRRLRDLGYLTLRYPRGNRLGVRFEPWHIRVV